MLEAKSFRGEMANYPLGKSVPPNRSGADNVAYLDITRAFGGNFFFCDNRLGDPIKPFNEVLKEAINIQPIRDNKGNLVLVSDINFRGPSKLKTTISVLREGKKGEPVIAHIPGFGNSSYFILPYIFGLNEIRDCTIIGIEPFHNLSRVDQAKAGSRFENLMTFFASAVAAQDLVARIAQKVGAPFYLIGGSFGAKVINIALNAPNDLGLTLAGRYLAISGGRLDATFSSPQSSYVGHMPVTDRSFLEHPAITSGYGFPYQAEPLPEEGARLTSAVINPYDRVALGQSGIWLGANTILSISGEHSRAPIRYCFPIRRIIAKDLINLRQTQGGYKPKNS